MQATKNKRTNRYQLSFTDSSGKRQQFTGKAYFPAELKKKDADKRALKIYLQHEKDLKRDSKSSTNLNDCVERMLEHLENTGVKDVQKIRGHANIALEWSEGRDILDVVKVASEMKHDMLKRRKPNGERYKGSYIRKLMNTFIRTANLAFDEWNILDTPLGLKIKNAKASKPRIRYLTRDEAKTILNSCDEHFSHIISFFILTGIRHEEFQRLDNEDISATGLLTIDGKTNHMRSLQLSEAAMINADHIDFSENYTYAMINRRLQKAKKESGILDFGLHDLRHTFATWLLQSGDATLHEIQKLLGHSNITQTDKYAHLAPSSLAHITTNLTL